MEAKINVIVACDSMNGIGKDGGIPWFCKKDLKYFAKITTTTTKPNKKNVVIMGRKTYFSIPEDFRPLCNRYNIIISKTVKEIPGTVVTRSLHSAIQECFSNQHKIDTIWIIGGGQIYNDIMKYYENIVHKVYITQMEENYNCDTFFPVLSENWEIIESTKDTEQQNNNIVSFYFNVYQEFS